MFKSIRERAAAPDKPFFLYYVPGGSHSPHQPKAEWVEMFKGKFDLGWNAMREQIFANQKRLGVIPDNAKLTEWPDSLPKWDTLSADQKKLFARQAEVYAGYSAYTDYEIGRVIHAVEDMGQLDNTLIIYICGDNGTSPEGTLSGTPNQYTSYNGILDFPIAEQLKFYDAWGWRGPTRIWRSRGHGHSTRRSSTRNRSPRTLAAHVRVWPSRGRTASRIPAGYATGAAVRGAARLARCRGSGAR